MHRETEIVGNAKPSDHLTKPRGRERRTALRREDKRRWRILLSRRRAHSSRPDNGWTDSAAGWGPEAPRFLDRLLASRWTTYWSYLESRYPQTFCGVHTYVVVALAGLRRRRPNRQRYITELRDTVRDFFCPRGLPCGSHLPADLHRHLYQGQLCQALRSQDTDHGRSNISR